ncbi:MAG: galactokinase [Actinomycetota bacterium]|nr:galactokinase [Actinomycetota bacterium]
MRASGAESDAFRRTESRTRKRKNEDEPSRDSTQKAWTRGAERHPPAGAWSEVTILEDVLEAHPQPDVLVRAPGRANLIGEHTDYNLGFVLPVALELTTYLAGTRRPREIHLRSLNEPGEVAIDLGRLPERVAGWGRYVYAVVRSLIDEGVQVQGLDGVIGSSVPLGTGLSSSAALEIALATALSPDLDPVHKAELCRRAEHDYVGVQVGIMDQLASAAARADHALLIDCSDNSIEHVPIPRELAVLIIDSGTGRDLQSSAYNDRRGDCEEAARVLSASSLREVTLDELEDGRDRMGTNAYRRARHVITENERVLATVAALDAVDFDAVGDLFAEAHRSYAQDFGASLPEIDALVDIARRTPGVVAARLTGGGFGGCTVNLVYRTAAGEAARTIASTYEDSIGKNARWWLSEPAAGAGPVDLDGTRVWPGRT